MSIATFAKFKVNSDPTGTLWFVADEVSRQVVMVFKNQRSAVLWLRDNEKVAGQMLKEMLKR